MVYQNIDYHKGISKQPTACFTLNLYTDIHEITMYKSRFRLPCSIQYARLKLTESKYSVVLSDGWQPATQRALRELTLFHAFQAVRLYIHIRFIIIFEHNFHCESYTYKAYNSHGNIERHITSTTKTKKNVPLQATLNVGKLWEQGGFNGTVINR